MAAKHHRRRPAEATAAGQGGRRRVDRRRRQRRPSRRRAKQAGRRRRRPRAAKPSPQPQQAVADQGRQAAKQAGACQAAHEGRAAPRRRLPATKTAAKRRHEDGRRPRQPPSAPKHRQPTGAKTPAADKPRRPHRRTATPPTSQLPKPKFNKDGLGYTKDFDLPFVKAQFDAAAAGARSTSPARPCGSRTRRTSSSRKPRWATCSSTTRAARATRWSSSASATWRSQRPGPRGRRRDRRRPRAHHGRHLRLLGRSPAGRSRKERLEAIPWASVLVEEKVGGIGRR